MAKYLYLFLYAALPESSHARKLMAAAHREMRYCPINLSSSFGENIQRSGRARRGVAAANFI